MKNLIIFFLIFSNPIFSQNGLKFKVSKNTLDGEGLKDANIRLDGAGNVLSDNDGFGSFKNIPKPDGERIRIDASLTGYKFVNDFHVQDFVLPKDRTGIINIILAKSNECDKYRRIYIESAFRVILVAPVEKQILELTQKIDELAKNEKKLLIKNTETTKLYNSKIDSLTNSLKKLYSQRDIESEKANDVSNSFSTALAQNLEIKNLADKKSNSFGEAFDLFKSGKFEEAQKKLDENELNQQLLEIEAADLENQKKKKKTISNCILKAQLFSISGKISEAKVWYEKAIKMDSTNYLSLFSFAFFLQNQREFLLSRKLYSQALIFITNTEEKARILNNLGVISDYINDVKSAESNYLLALEEKQILFKNDSITYLPLIASTLNNLGVLYARSIKDTLLAEKYYLESLKYYRLLARKIPLQYLNIINNLSLIYKGNSSKIANYASISLEGMQSCKQFAEESQNNYFWRLGLRFMNDITGFTNIDPSYERKVALLDSNITFYKSYSNFDNSILAALYGNKAFYSIFNRNYIEAEKSALLGLKLNSDEFWIYTNLAPALLFQNRIDEAIKIYEEKKSLIWKNKSLKKYFLEDLVEFEKNGITNINISRVREVLNDE